MKSFIALSLVVLLSGCSALSKFIPSNFDNAEFGKLVELNVVSMSVNAKTEDWCNPMIIGQMNYRAEWLYTYSKYRLNDNITQVYKGIHGLTTELIEREAPSSAYCKIKRQSIHKITSDTLTVFGSRKS